ncbi:hypothetical protein B4Q04_03565 [Zobellia sp. OII3]|uniref:hypothetical protein n=1 Tax=Zobellia sp. OII3 TaxID=2034520 RepID=UPI000B52AA82|nr:hypothetical protein [Zobellia sp. OII3]OWW26771.1 hypothetical protein B4Q04_03565 [Zobellia sp. OII3]
MGKNSFKLEVMGQTKTLDVIVNDIRFFAILERPDDYSGEFGFDWMRSDYKNSCADYDKLKNEYTPTEIEGEEYFVPWLSMFPNQEGVKLKLVLIEPENHTNIGTPTEDDIIKFKAKSGIRFEPEQMTLQDTKDNDVITVFCDQPLTNDVSIDILNRDDEIVGKLNVYKNAHHKKLHFNITPVRVLRKGIAANDAKTIEDTIDGVNGFGNKNSNIEGDLQNLETYLNKRSLNQALLQCTIGKVYDIVIDENKWIADDLILDEGCIFKGDAVLDKLFEEFQKQHPNKANKKDMVVFLNPLKKEDAGGEGNLRDVDARQLAIYLSNLNSLTTFAHEIAHFAGLEHSFKGSDDVPETDIHAMNEYIIAVDNQMNSMLANNDPKNEISELWRYYQEDYAKYRGYLNSHYRNPYKFDKKSTENLMDYSDDRISFWKFQWKVLQEEVLKFYANP